MSEEDRVRRIVRGIERLSPAARVQVHREAARLAEPVYRKLYASNYQTGMMAARSRLDRAARAP